MDSSLETGKGCLHLNGSSGPWVGESEAVRLKRYLDRFLEAFSPEDHIVMDPVQFVHRYADPADREVAAFVASAFAYGNVRGVLKTVSEILNRMGPRPARFLDGFHPNRHTALFSGVVHRWNNGRDVAVLLWILRRLLEDHASIESLLVGGMRGSQRSMACAMEHFSNIALSLGHEKFYSNSDLALRRGVRFFFPRPSDGGACKRLNLYARWMVRPDDGVDCGVWHRIRPAELVVPLDTHIARISSYIGLTGYATPGWKMAVEITESLKRLDARDPVKYDFALCHLGIAGDCPKKRDPVNCLRCPIQPVCRL